MTLISSFYHTYKLQTGSPSLGGFTTKTLSYSFFLDVGGNWRERAVSFPKIILRPHFKKEKPKAFGGRWGRISKSEGNEERRRWGVGTAFLGGVGVCRQRWLAYSQQGVGPLSPCMGLSKDRAKDNVRGRHRWCTKALLCLKRGLYSIWFARYKK